MDTDQPSAEATATRNPATRDPATRFEIIKIYLKDASFEAPATPGIFLNQDAKPEVGVEVALDYESIDDEKGLLETVLNVTVTSKINGTVAYLAETHQAGIFQIVHPKPQAHRFITEVTTPQVLLPFARETLNSLITRGGFKSFLLSPFNFEAIYKDKLQREREMAKSATADAPESIN